MTPQMEANIVLAEWQNLRRFIPEERIERLSEELKKHWQLLWPLPAVARVKCITEIAADLDFEAQLRDVAKEMADA